MSNVIKSSENMYSKLKVHSKCYANYNLKALLIQFKNNY